MEPAEFKQKLLEAVDYGLMALGGVVRQTIYLRIEKDHGLVLAEIPEQLEVFHKALESMLGAGAMAVEKFIAKNFYGRLGLNFTPRPEWTLVDYVNHAKTVSESIRVHE